MADGGDAPGLERTLADPLAEALRIVDAADRKGLLVRLMGGMAIRAHAPDWPARTRQVEVDLDFAPRSKARGAFYQLIEAEGFEKFIDVKYTGTKRFGLDGAEAMAPAAGVNAAAGRGTSASAVADLSNINVNQNVDPTPTMLCRPKSPPMPWVRCFTIARPIPPPPYFRVGDSSAWVNGSKMR